MAALVNFMQTERSKTTVTYAVSWSGGKDSTLALDRAIRRGLHVSHLFNIYEGSSGLVRFHGVHYELIQRQADTLGISLIQKHTHPQDYPTVLHEILAELGDSGITGVIFGNIHLADIRAWFEVQTSQYDLEHVEPLWGDPPEQLAQEFIYRGYASTIVGIDLSKSPEEWLGKQFDPQFLQQVRNAESIDLCGERGEYHSFVWRGPLFQRDVDYVVSGHGEIDGHRYLDMRSP